MRAVHQPLGAEVADRLQPDAHLHADLALRRADGFELRLPLAAVASALPKRIFLNSFGNSFAKKSSTFCASGEPAAYSMPGVDVLGVLAEDHHVDFLRMLHRRRHALEPAHRPQADIQIEHLAQRDVQRSDAAADRRGQRAFDADEVRRGTRRAFHRAASC